MRALRERLRQALSEWWVGGFWMPSLKHVTKGAMRGRCTGNQKGEKDSACHCKVTFVANHEGPMSRPLDGKEDSAGDLPGHHA